MNRRKFIGTIGATSLVGLAGCATILNQSGSGVMDYSFSKASADNVPDETQITAVEPVTDGGATVTIRGKVHGRNGCIETRVGSEPEMTSSADPTRVETMIETYEPEDSGMCTGAIKPIGYEIVVTCASRPDEIVVSEGGQESDEYTLTVPGA